MTRVVIIGAGIIGLATAYELRQRNVEVILVDPRAPGSAASSGNTGWVVPALSAPIPAPGLPLQVARWMLNRDSPFQVDPTSAVKELPWLYTFWRRCNQSDHARGLSALGRLNVASYRAMSRWREAGLSFEHDEQGVLFVASNPAEIHHLVEELDTLAPHGYQPAEWLDQRVLHDLEPALSRDIEQGILARREQHVRPESLIGALVDALADDNVSFIRAPLSTVQPDAGGRVGAVTAGNRELVADAFVIAAGAWTGEVARQFRTRVPVISGKGYSITVESPELELRQPLYLSEAKIACSPFEGANRFAGMMELTGPDDSISPGRLMTMVKALNRALPGWDRGSRRVVWAGLRPMSPDGLPVIGKAPGLENVYVSSGHGMLGVTMAPVTGEIIAEMIASGSSPYDVHAFDPRRFA